MNYILQVPYVVLKRFRLTSLWNIKN